MALCPMCACGAGRQWAAAVHSSSCNRNGLQWRAASVPLLFVATVMGRNTRRQPTAPAPRVHHGSPSPCVLYAHPALDVVSWCVMRALRGQRRGGTGLGLAAGQWSSWLLLRCRPRPQFTLSLVYTCSFFILPQAVGAASLACLHCSSSLLPSLFLSLFLFFWPLHGATEMPLLGMSSQ